MNKMPLRVVVVDDHPVFRIGMVALLEELPGVEVVGEAATETAAVEIVLETRPDVVVMDLDLAGGSGARATQEILVAAPATRVLVITMLGDDEAIFDAVRVGARGYLVKGAAPEEIERALRAIADGAVLLGPQVAQRAVDYLTGARNVRSPTFADLTDRERDVLELVARGHDNAAVARMLVLTSKTVRNYVSSVLTKLDVADRSALIVKARAAGVGLSSSDPDRGDPTSRPLGSG